MSQITQYITIVEVLALVQFVILRRNVIQNYVRPVYAWYAKKCKSAKKSTARYYLYCSADLIWRLREIIHQLSSFNIKHKICN